VQLQPWITRLPPSDQNTGKSLRVLDDAHSSLHEVARALEIFVFKHQRQESESLHGTISRFEHAKPGQRALLWLLKSNAIRDIAFLEHPTVLRSVSHCLVAEGGLRWLQDWLTQTDNPLASLPKSEALVPDLTDRFWRGRVLLNTVEAQANWTRNPLVLDESLGTFNSMITYAQKQRMYRVFSMAGKWLSNTIRRRRR
jgi:hypothetical protein